MQLALEEAHACLASLCRDSEEPGEGEVIVELTDLDTAQKHAQKEFTSKVSRSQRLEVLREAEDEQAVARLLSASGYAAGMWLQGSLTDRSMRMSGQVFMVAMKLRLGMACGLVCTHQSCAICGEVVDAQGWHHLTCSGAQLIARHDRFVAQLAGMMRAAVGRGKVHVEMVGTLEEGAGSKRMDIVVDSGDGGEMTQIDAAVCTPMASSYLQAAQEAGGAAALRQSSKHSKYDRHVPEGSTFIAAVVEAVGAWGSEMQEWWQAVLGTLAAEAQEAGEMGDSAASQFANSWLPRLAVGLQRGNALAIIHRCRRDRVAMGKSSGGRRPRYHDDSY